MWSFSHMERQTGSDYPRQTSIAPPRDQALYYSPGQDARYSGQLPPLYQSGWSFLGPPLYVPEPAIGPYSSPTQRPALPQAHLLHHPDATYPPPSSATSETLSGIEHPSGFPMAPTKQLRSASVNKRKEHASAGSAQAKSVKKQELDLTKKRVQPPRQSASKVQKTGFYDVRATFRGMQNGDPVKKEAQSDPVSNKAKLSNSTPIVISSDEDDLPLGEFVSKKFEKRSRLPAAPVFSGNTVDARAEVIRLSEQIAQLYQDLETEEKKFKAQLDIAHDTIDLRNQEIREKDRQLSVANEKLQMAEANGQHLESQRQELNTKLQEMEKTQRQLEREAHALRQDVEFLRNERQDLQATGHQQQLDLREMQKEINTWKEEALEKKEECTCLQNNPPNNVNFVILQEELATAQNELHKLQKSRRATQDNASDSQSPSRSAYEDIEAENTRLREALTKEKERMDDFISNMDKIEAANRISHKAKITDLEATIAELRTENTDLKKAKNTNARNDALYRTRMSTPPDQSSPTPVAHPLSPVLTHLPSASSSEMQMATDNVRNTFLKNKKKYDRLVSIASRVTSATATWDLSCIGELGTHLWQLKQALQNKDD